MFFNVDDFDVLQYFDVFDDFDDFDNSDDSDNFEDWWRFWNPSHAHMVPYTVPMRKKH